MGLSEQGFDRRAALGWLRDSLEGGHAISTSVLQTVDLARGRLLCVLPNPPPQIVRFEWGGVISMDLAEAILGEFLAEAMSRGTRSIVVESDVALRGDPNVGVPGLLTAYTGDHVIHAMDLTDPLSPGTTGRALYMTAAYPLNAFLLDRRIAEVGLAEGSTLSESSIAEVTGAVCAIIVGAFDGESFLIWAPPPG